MRRSDQVAKWLFWLVAVGFVLTADLSLLNGDPLGTVSEALFGGLYALAALGVEPSRRPGGRLLVWVVAIVALVLYLLSLYGHFFA